ncbi:MAG: hypothetical protein D6675_06205 [Gemmatimonadetes bacterium]|nr:MAG: hypothetical protein D6675_06205 [Gemmatimonadota bacterium]
MEQRNINFIHTTVGILIVIGIVVLVNILAQRFFVRVDLTEDQVYSLSKASKEIMRNLDDKVLIKAYFSKDLPPPYNANERFIRDQLDEYRAYSNGNLQYEFINPDENEENKQEAQQLGISPVQINVLEKDRMESKVVYMGLVISYEDKREVMPFIQRLDGFEYDMTSAIQRITSDAKPKVAFLQGHDEPDMLSNEALRVEMEKSYNVQNLTLEGSDLIPDDVDALVIIAPQTPLSEWEQYAVDQYIMKGGKVAFLLDPIKADLQSGMATALPLEMDDWLATYGIKVNADLVFDASNQPVSVQQQQRGFIMRTQMPFPFIPVVRNFNDNHVMVKDIEAVVFPFLSTIDTTLAPEKGLNIEVLATTSELCGTQTGRFDINPMNRIPRQSYVDQYLPVGAVISGKFHSYFADKGAPTPEVDEDNPQPTTDLPVNEVIPESQSENRLVVFGDGEFTQNATGTVLLMNMIDWMTQGEGLISIRSKGVTDRPLKEVDDATKPLIKYANFFGMPLVVIILGILYWQVRRRRKREI